MKNILFLPLLALFLFVSCKKIDSTEKKALTTESKVKIKLGLKSTENAEAAVSPNELKKKVNYLYIKAYTEVEDIEGTILRLRNVDSVKQTSNDPNFGNVVLNLPPGDYKLIAAASKDPINFVDGFDYQTTTGKAFIHVTNTDFYVAKQSIKVEPGKPINLSLVRLVAQFQFRIRDAIPADVTKIEIEYNDITRLGLMFELDSIGGSILGGEPIKLTKTFTPGDIGKKNVTLNSYTLFNDRTITDNYLFPIKISVYRGESVEEIVPGYFDAQVPMFVNKKSILCARLFSIEKQFQVVSVEDFEENIDISF